MDFTKPKGRYIFEKGDCKVMRQALQTLGWIEDYNKLVNKPDLTPEELGEALTSKLNRLTKELVSFVNPSNKPPWKDKGDIPMIRNR